MLKIRLLVRNRASLSLKQNRSIHIHLHLLRLKSTLFLTFSAAPTYCKLFNKRVWLGMARRIGAKAFRGSVNSHFFVKHYEMFIVWLPLPDAIIYQARQRI
jgi:hypothetical protein